MAKDEFKDEYSEDIEDEDYDVDADEVLEVLDFDFERLVVEGGKNDKQLEKYYEAYAKYRFTGSKKREEEFYSSLNEEQKNVYDKAKGSNQEVSNRFFQIMGTSPEEVKEVKEVQKKKGNKKGRREGNRD